jgi:hypothetical protein
VRQVDIPKTKYFFFDLINRTINDLSANALVLAALCESRRIVDDSDIDNKGIPKNE